MIKVQILLIVSTLFVWAIDDIGIDKDSNGYGHMFMICDSSKILYRKGDDESPSSWTWSLDKEWTPLFLGGIPENSRLSKLSVTHRGDEFCYIMVLADNGEIYWRRGSSYTAAAEYDWGDAIEWMHVVHGSMEDTSPITAFGYFQQAADTTMLFCATGSGKLFFRIGEFTHAFGNTWDSTGSWFEVPLNGMPSNPLIESLSFLWGEDNYFWAYAFLNDGSIFYRKGYQKNPSSLKWDAEITWKEMNTGSFPGGERAEKVAFVDYDFQYHFCFALLEDGALVYRKGTGDAPSTWDWQGSMSWKTIDVTNRELNGQAVDFDMFPKENDYWLIFTATPDGIEYRRGHDDSPSSWEWVDPIDWEAVNMSNMSELGVYRASTFKKSPGSGHPAPFLLLEKGRASLFRDLKADGDIFRSNGRMLPRKDCYRGAASFLILKAPPANE